MLRLSGSSDIKDQVRAWFEARGDLAGTRIVDVPAGGGSISRFLLDQGARVDALDLFPELCKAEGVDCRRADLRVELPLADGLADIVLFQEAIEHLENPLHALRELSASCGREGRCC